MAPALPPRVDTARDLPSLKESPLALLETALDYRQADRMAIADLPIKHNPGIRLPFDPRLCYELALNMYPAREVFERHGISGLAALDLCRYPAFISQVQRYRQEITDGGVSFKLKAKLQAEELLAHSYDMATDPETPAAVRADLIKWTAAVAELGPKGKEGATAGSGFTLNLVFGQGNPKLEASPDRAAIDVTPTREAA